MDFPIRLSHALGECSDAESHNSRIFQWNEEVEGFLAAPPSSSVSEDTKEESSEEMISEVAQKLHEGIIGAFIQRPVPDEEIEIETQQATHACREKPDLYFSKHLFELIKAAKNLIRWHIQIFLGQKGNIFPSPVATLQSLPLLELLVCVLKHQALKEKSLEQALSRNIALYLFYATYITFPGDETTHQALNYVIVSLGFTELALRMLTRSCTAALALALIRNLHNAICTLQGASDAILTTKIDWDPSAISFSDPAPWAPPNECQLDFQSTCVNVLLWAMNSDPPFPGPDDDRRGELASEILGAFYALRAGKQLVPGQCDKNLLDMVVKLLKLPDDNQDKRINQCKLSTMSILMDADPSFGHYLLQKECISYLLELLDTQVTHILNHTRVDNSAAAALVPILVVLNKYASADTDIYQQVRSFVFPAETEEAFQAKANPQQQGNAVLTNKQKKNMGPLDAPAGTLRRKLCDLLTWPEGHIKRCTGELLWTLCSSNATEFVHRVGYGNALPLLTVKGFAKMPIPES